MKLMLLADLNSTHTIKWVTSLSLWADEIMVCGLSALETNAYQSLENVKTIALIAQPVQTPLFRISYIRVLPEIQKILRDFSPDILHAHFASSYGLLGALSGFHPYILSVCGTDVFAFPNKSFLHTWILKYNFWKADKILSTSHVMADEIKRYTYKEVEVTPFGIDIMRFKPASVRSIFGDSDIVIGTIKALEKEYGIEYLIKAFKLLTSKYPDMPLKLLIVGGGSLEKSLKQLTQELELEDKVYFTGKVSFEEVPKYHNMLSVFVSLSNSESFGVAIVEASSCGKPVVVSNVGGLPEVVENGISGYVVSARDPVAASDVMEKLVLDTELCSQIGKQGRERVKRLYNWEDNVKQMISIYEEI